MQGKHFKDLCNQTNYIDYISRYTGTFHKVALGNTHKSGNHQTEKAQTWRSRSSSLVAKSKMATSMVSPLNLPPRLHYSYIILLS